MCRSGISRDSQKLITDKPFRARMDIWAQWVHDYGNFDCIRLSHGWHTWWRREQEHTTDCRPIVMQADLRCGCHERGCQCVGDLVHRAACLQCSFEGPVRLSENEAAEDCRPCESPYLPYRLRYADNSLSLRTSSSNRLSR
ncbi:DUF6349 family protein [Mycobacteroides abscessus]|uniref:DUF6349 family protein n=2 Tax=Mycobacteroides abscessus TaxID=36809 RepID=UPI00373FD54E